MTPSSLPGGHSTPLIYTELPSGAFSAARDSLAACGFAPGAILEAYDFSTRDYPSVRVNALAFAHPVHRTLADYAGVSLYNAAGSLIDEEIIPVLAQSSAPFHLIHRGDAFSFWASAYSDNQVQTRRIAANVAYAELRGILGDYSTDLTPQRIVAVKQGREHFQHPLLHDLRPFQLSLWSLDVTGQVLVDRFRHALSMLRDGGVPKDQIDDLATQLLGTIILADTNVFGDSVRLASEQYDLDRMASKATEHFPRYFKKEVLRRYHAAYQAYDILRQVRFSSFAPAMLKEVYTAAYHAAERKRLGRYDTPLFLTRRIWDALPVEYLPPDRRNTADMTCGWGSFLIAGQERLSRLTDLQGRSVRDHIHGCDIDMLTSRLAGLGLLTATSEDNWHIDRADALSWQWLDLHQPDIIVGNPPFAGDRKTQRADPSLPKEERSRQQEADRYLDRALDRLAPGGFLAMLMPTSFVAAEASPHLRQKLLSTCDIFELWELPIDIFPEATAETMVIFARKHDGVFRSHHPVRVRTVQQKGTLEHFKKPGGPFTISGYAADQSTWDERSRKSTQSKNTHIIDYRFILSERLWQRVRSNSVDIANYAVIFAGAIVGKNPLNKPWRDYPNPRTVPWLTGGKDVLTRSFFVSYDRASTIKYPNDLVRPRKNIEVPKKDREQLLEGTKVLMTSDPNPSWGKRVKVAIERRNHFVSGSFWVIVPNERAAASGITHEVLTAVLDWYVSNAWIIEQLKYPWIPERAISTIPFPMDLKREDWTRLTEAIRRLEAAAALALPEPLEPRATIDAILQAAYGLDNATVERLRIVAEWDRRPRVTLDPQPDPDDADYLISGVVERVDAGQETITLWISGFEELQTVPIHPSMPGWMLRPEAAFRVEIPYACKHQRSLSGVEWGAFVPQQYTYLEEEELVERIGRIFQAHAVGES